MEIRVRNAEIRDAAMILNFINKLAEFEKEPLSNILATEESIIRDGFGEKPGFECLIADVNEKAVGFVLFFQNYSTWEARSGIYVEDLFVEEKYRNFGVGEKLLSAIARIAIERNLGRIELSVLDWNPARRFYEKLGMQEMPQWITCRLEGSKIDKLAASRK